MLGLSEATAVEVVLYTTPMRALKRRLKKNNETLCKVLAAAYEVAFQV